ncbi:MAG: type IV pilus secretin PilQ [Desulfobacterales bacterium]|nr:type IV pilus secretin PilQ [Desulfobacterales bacterium]
MKQQTSRSTRNGMLSVLLTVWLIAFSGCAAQKAAEKAADAPEAPAEPKAITAVQTAEDSDSIRISISGNRVLTYTSVKQPFPEGVVLYFPETVLNADVADLYPVDSDPVDSVKVAQLDDKGPTARVEILLTGDAPYQVERDGDGLSVTFAKPSFGETSMAVVPDQTAEPMAAEPAETPTMAMAAAGGDNAGASANRLRAVTADPKDKGVTVTIFANGPIADYNSFSLKNPARIVFDLHNLDSPFKGEQIVSVESPWVKRVRHYRDADKLRVVLDTENQYLNAFSAAATEKGLRIHVGELAALASDMASPAPVPVSAATAGVAWVNRVDFASEEGGKSTILIGTTEQVEYKIKKVNDRRLLLSLFGAKIPGYRQRPLITTRFESAVDRVTPVQSTTMKDTALVNIELREAVPYFVDQVDNLLMVHLEPSAVPPKAAEEAGLPEWKQVLAQTAEILPEAAGADEMTSGNLEEKRTRTRTGAGKFTGEKIALDFYETDIKNVFRILREVSGKNYAIDKDVTGKVTLSLEKPVPWDQVLDLVLRMNQLGMVYEGDIVRVATLTTMKNEESLRQAAMAAAKKSLDDQQELEPLVTEYIPINYSNASADILPHLKNVVSARGKLSVHAATNQIIIKDTADRVAEAKALVRELDQVTRQVLIEARVVEATSNFTRTLGAKFSVGPGTGTTWNSSNLGGDWDLNVASNYVTSPTAAFNFGRIIGSPLTLNAELQASETESETKTISAPKILTMDNKAATIKTGTSYPISKLDANGNSTTEFKDIVLSLTVTPHVTLDDRISLVINISKNDVGAQIGSNVSFTVNEANTELLLNDGDTVVIGGITKTNKVNSDEGVPGLSKMPILGWLFKSKTRTKTMNELLIFITPRILKLDQKEG